MPHRRSRLLAFLAASAAAVVALLSPAPASAGLLVASAPDCTTPDSSAVFAPWYDHTNYFLAPDGGFENGAAGWDLDGASVAAGNNSFDLSGPGAASLALSSGDTATSPTVCVGIEHPTMRFLLKKNGGSFLSSLRVDVLTETSLGLVVAVPIATVSAGSNWQPGPQVLNVANLLPLLPGSHTPVRYRFVAQGGQWQVDDVFVDPTGKR